MSLIALQLLFLFNFNSPDLSGVWKFEYKAIGKKVNREITIQQHGDKAIVSSDNEKFVIDIIGADKVNWLLEITSLKGTSVASFQGEINSNNKMSGILLMSDYPLNGRSVRWTAKRVIKK